jgi:hypothetical protein
MLYDILFVTSLLLTRIALPLIVTLALGSLIERALRRDRASAS